MLKCYYLTLKKISEGMTEMGVAQKHNKLGNNALKTIKINYGHESAHLWSVD